ncbi:MAG: hypothetical protein AAGA25_06745 [Planctomycetota bacterium]
MNEAEGPPDSVAPFDVWAGTRLWMLLCNWVPVVHVVLVGLCVWGGERVSWWLGVLSGFAALYLLPAVVVRLVLIVWPIEAGKYALDSQAFRTWWLTAQWQVLFNRLPFLEELLRIMPCVYSMWLRLWGARVSGMVFWSPGTVVLDRPFVSVGRGSVLGIGTRLHPHLILRVEGDEKTPGDSTEVAKLEFWLSPVRIGEQSLVGGFSLLAPGVDVAPGSVTPAIHALPAFSTWESGRRVRKVRPTVV